MVTDPLWLLPEREFPLFLLCNVLFHITNTTRKIRLYTRLHLDGDEGVKSL